MWQKVVKFWLIMLVFPLVGQEFAMKIGDITWNPEKCVLTWTVQEGKLSGEKFTPERTIHYTIKFHEAKISDGVVELPFSPAEAERMHTYFHQLVTRYAMESTDWFRNEAAKGRKMASLEKRE